MSPKLWIPAFFVLVAVVACPTIEFSDEVGIRDDTHGIVKEIIIRPKSMCKNPNSINCIELRDIIVEIEGYEDQKMPVLRGVHLEKGMKIPIIRYKFDEGGDSMAIDYVGIATGQ